MFGWFLILNIALSLKSEEKKSSKVEATVSHSFTALRACFCSRMSFNLFLSFLCFSFATRQILPAGLHGPEFSPGSKVLLILENHSSVMQMPLIQINCITSGPTPPRDTDPSLGQLESWYTPRESSGTSCLPLPPLQQGEHFSPTVFSLPFPPHVYFEKQHGPLSGICH